MVNCPKNSDQREGSGRGTGYHRIFSWSMLKVSLHYCRKPKRMVELGGVKVCPRPPSVSHLLFVDDSLIMFRANGGDAQALQSILQIYEECSGQMINKDKSAIMFSPKTPVRWTDNR